MDLLLTMTHQLFNYDNSKLILIGKITNKCSYSDALKWYVETLGLCCSSGKVCLPHFKQTKNI